VRAITARGNHSALPRLLLLPVLERVFGASYDDMHRMEAILRGSDVGWVALRPTRLLVRHATGRYRLDPERSPTGGCTLTYAAN
jgi:hypothetical protein